VYCAAPAAEVDHVRPLSRGGYEHASNLVPACKSCNSGKKDRLLDEWDPVRVARAAKASKKVKAEWGRLLVGQDSLF
jgi:5-methylcytosine-specific restriction endonuclease McrA